MHIEAVIFDLDNTLYDENSLVYAVCKAFCAKYELDSSLISGILQDSFRLSSRDIFGDWLKSFDFYTKTRQEELFALYQTLPAPLSLYDDAKAFLLFLQARGIRLGILTNGHLSAQQHKAKLLKLEGYGIDIEYARAKGIAYEKPHIDAFNRILTRLEKRPQECIFIGDNPHTDIAGANEAGIYSIRLQRGYGRLIACDEGSRAKQNIVDFKELRSLWQ